MDPWCVREYRVSEDHLAGHLSARGVKVLSTPSLLLFIERSVRECLDSSLGEGLVSVGYRVDLKHLKPAALGDSIRVEAFLLDRSGSRLLVYVRVYRGDGSLIGEAVHERRITDLDSIKSRL